MLNTERHEKRPPCRQLIWRQRHLGVLDRIARKDDLSPYRHAQINI
jgi:hypothetical protein